jgi:hypothetical protein
MKKEKSMLKQYCVREHRTELVVMVSITAYNKENNEDYVALTFHYTYNKDNPTEADKSLLGAVIGGKMTFDGVERILKEIETEEGMELEALTENDIRISLEKLGYKKVN